MNRTTSQLGVGMVLAVLLAGSLAATPALAADPVEVTFESIGAEQQFVVPDGVTSIHVVLIGAQGGAPNTGWSGGQGARVTADLVVTGGSVLFVEVGGNGVHFGGSGGFNGGGYSYSGGPGGGASDLRTIPRANAGSLTSRLAVAAGGGGAGYSANGGDAGDPGEDSLGGATGGAAGTASSGGVGGTGPAGKAADGSAGAGGEAVAQLDPHGGGGGGLFGGGAGADDLFGAAGGGGGSSLVPAGGSLSIETASVPKITISYDATALPTITFTSGQPPAGQVGQPYSFQYTATGDDGITFAGGQLPPGLTLDATGLLSGIPTASGTLPADVTAIGSSGARTSREDLVTIAAAPLALPIASVAPASVDFGSQTIGTTSPARVVTLSNTGNGPLMIGPVNIGGGNAADFVKSGDSCSGQALAPGGTCSVSVTFSPTVLGPRSATLAFVDDAAGSPQNVAIAGSGVAPLADLGIGLATTAARKGVPFTYVITVTNHGPSTAADVIVSDSLPSTTRFVGVSTNKGTCQAPPAGSTGTITCSIGTLAVMESSVTRIAVTVELKKGTLSNTASVSSAIADPNLANNSATIMTR